MIQNYEKRVLKLNAPLRGYPAGTEVKIKVDSQGTPVERYWRDRLNDAEKDKCVEFVGKKTSTKPTTKLTEVKKDVDKEA